MRIKAVIFVCLIVICFPGISQDVNSQRRPSIFSIGAGVGAISFFGEYDYNSSSRWTSLSEGYNFKVQKNIYSGLLAEASLMKGDFGMNVRNSEMFMAMKNDFLMVDLNLHYRFSNIWKKTSGISPYIGLGIGLMQYQVSEDKMGANDLMYHHWDDGSLRSLEQNHPKSAGSTIIEQDYVYETTFAKSTAFFAPISAGVYYQFSPILAVDLGAKYSMIFSDDIDANTSKPSDDGLLYVSASVIVNIVRRDPVKKMYRKINHQDLDNDGVLDTKDMCQLTPKDVKVDRHGCPLDKDGDGVPDYQDIEPATPKGMEVTPKGVGLTDEIIAKLYQLRDSVEVSQRNFIGEKIEHEKISIIGSVLPEEVAPMDLNHNSYIEVSEVVHAIDDFFEGTKPYTIDNLTFLVDYFFDQD